MTLLQAQGNRVLTKASVRDSRDKMLLRSIAPTHAPVRLPNPVDTVEYRSGQLYDTLSSRPAQYKCTNVQSR